MSADNQTMNTPASQRRVGTISMGLTLIATGVIGLCNLFIDGFDLIKALSFSPVILIVLGAEMLIFYFIKKGERLKFDVLSCFICLIIFITSMGVMMIMPIYNAFGPPRYRYEQTLTDQLYDKSYGAMKAFDCISDYDVNVSVYPAEAYAGHSSEDNIRNASIYITLWNKYAKAEDFVKDCRAIMAALNGLALEPDTVCFNVKDNDSLYLTLRGKLQQGFDEAHLLELVSE